MAHPTDPCGPAGYAYGAPVPGSNDTSVPASCTFCDRDKVNNIWAPGADPTGVRNPCLLDTLELCNIIYIIQRDPLSRTDLQRITSNAELLNLLETVPMLPSQEDEDILMTQMNKNEVQVLYTHFRGQPPFNQ